MTDLSRFCSDIEGGYKKTVLDNGVRIITQRAPYFQSTAMGIWVRTGSRHEQPEVNGICHFIEHMLFKGTPRRSALAIAKEIDAVGGQLNAFTSKEVTSFYSRVLHEHTGRAVDLLADIYLNSTFPEDEIDRERMVISQEISLLEDTPEELVHEIFSMEFWRDDPLGRPILGELTTIEKIDRATMLDFKERHYTSGDTVICAAGRVDHDEFVDLFGRHMSALPRYEAKPQPKSAATAYPALVAPRDLEQAHVCIGMTGPGALEDTRHAAYILSNVLGGGMSSRLFQEVREKRGLAYSVYSFVSSFSDTGLFGLYAGCDPERLEELLGVLGEELFGIADSITKEETDDAKQQMRGNIILGMESTDALMNRLAKSEFHFGRQVLLDEIIGKVENVPTEQPAELARQLLSPERCAIIALGPVEPDTDLRAMLTAKIK